MKTNTELLINALGWQGGTVHQVAQETGLSVLEILDLDKYYPADGDSRAAAYMFVGTHRTAVGIRPSFPVAEETTGYDLIMYWRGVLAAMQQKESK